MEHKLSWIERVRKIEEYHKKLIRIDYKHRTIDTANLLHRSHGSICEDLMLAEWLRIYPKLEEFKTADSALIFVRVKKKEMRLR